jgi:phage terminase small subunit
MSRPRKPTSLLEASGAFRHNPSRRAGRADEPKPTGDLGPPPDWLGVRARKCWHGIAASVPYPLTNADGHILALTAHLESRVRGGRASAAEFNQYRACLREIGMTPASRSNVSVPKSENRNEFAEI